MRIGPCVAYDNKQNGNDYVMTDMKMSIADPTEHDDIGESDITTASSISRPNVPLTHFRTSSMPGSVAHSTAQSRPIPQSSQQNCPPTTHTNKNLSQHRAAAEVTDSSDSSGGTESSTRHVYGSSPPLNNENYPINNTSQLPVNTTLPAQQRQPPLSISTPNTMQTNSSKDIDASSQQDSQTKSSQLKSISSTMSCWSKVPQRKETVLRRLSETLIRGTLTLIDLSQRNLGANDARLIRLALLQNPNLSVLKLGYNHLGDDGITLIASAIHGHSHLSVLDVGFNCIGDAGCSALATDAVANNYVLHTLYLSGNTVGENGAFALSQAIIGDIGGGGSISQDKANPPGCGLRCLHLTANSIKANGVKALTRAITISESRIQEKYHFQASTGQKHSMHQPRSVQFDGYGDYNINQPISTSEIHGCRLEELFVGGTDMRSVGCLAVSNMMLTNFSLRVLSLSHNGITDKDLTLFSQSLSRNKSVPIEVLQLSFNQLTCVGVESLMNVVWGSQTLKDLRLDNNKIRDRGAQLVAVVLTSVNLERVDLGFNIITTVGIKALMKSLAENETLQSLTLSGNTLDTSASKAVSYALAYNKHLISLYLDNCSVGYAAQRHIAAGVASNSASSLRTLTGFRIGAIAVTLGLPPALENWANDQVLGFFRLMWEKWRKERMNGSYNSEDQIMASSVSLPVGNSRNSSKYNSNNNMRGSTLSLNGEQTNATVKKNGPIDPNTVVMVAKTTYENLGKDNSALLHWQNNHREVSLQSPLAPNDEMILETTPTGITRIPPANIFSQNTNLNVLRFNSEEENEMNGQTFSFPLENDAEKSVQVDPKKKEKLIHWLQQHASELNEVTHYPFDNADMWKLHQHFFSPVYNTESNKKSDTNSENDKSNISNGDTHMAPAQSSEINQSVPIRPSIPLAPTTNTNIQPQAQPSLASSRPLGRKTSYHSLSDSIISIPQSNPAQNYQQPQSSPSTTRRHSEMYADSSSSMQPAQKRAKKARISYFPRVKTKLEILRTKTSEHQALVLMRQLKYIENAMLNDNIFQSESGGFTIADAESILMDML